MTPNKSWQGSGTYKLLRRGRQVFLLYSSPRARVLKRTRPALELNRYRSPVEFERSVH